MSVSRFYDDLADDYHLIYDDWDAAVRRQGERLDAILRGCLGEGTLDVLDVACGIGTQSIGLALRGGYRVDASDISPAAIRRAVANAALRGADIAFSVADMTKARSSHPRSYDAVIACDNAIPHLLGDEPILDAFRQLHACTKENGVCLISVRDYEREPSSGVHTFPYGVRERDGKRLVLLQVWEFVAPSVYETTFYAIEDDGQGSCAAHAAKTKYYAVSTGRLLELLAAAGFRDVRRIDGAYFQPVLIGVR